MKVSRQVPKAGSPKFSRNSVVWLPVELEMSALTRSPLRRVRTSAARLTGAVSVSEVGGLPCALGLSEAGAAELDGLGPVEEALVEHEDPVRVGRHDDVDRFAEAGRVGVAGKLLAGGLSVRTRCGE